jgi:hypothetical protein
MVYWRLENQDGFAGFSAAMWGKQDIDMEHL